MCLLTWCLRSVFLQRVRACACVRAVYVMSPYSPSFLISYLFFCSHSLPIWQLQSRNSRKRSRSKSGPVRLLWVWLARAQIAPMRIWHVPRMWLSKVHSHNAHTEAKKKAHIHARRNAHHRVSDLARAQIAPMRIWHVPRITPEAKKKTKKKPHACTRTHIIAKQHTSPCVWLSRAQIAWYVPRMGLRHASMTHTTYTLTRTHMHTHA